MSRKSIKSSDVAIIQGYLSELESKINFHIASLNSIPTLVNSSLIPQKFYDWAVSVSVSMVETLSGTEAQFLPIDWANWLDELGDILSSTQSNPDLTVEDFQLLVDDIGTVAMKMQKGIMDATGKYMTSISNIPAAPPKAQEPSDLTKSYRTSYNTSPIYENSDVVDLGDGQSYRVHSISRFSAKRAYANIKSLRTGKVKTGVPLSRLVLSDEY